MNHKKKKHGNILQLDANDTLEKEDITESESSVIIQIQSQMMMWKQRNLHASESLLKTVKS